MSDFKRDACLDTHHLGLVGGLALAMDPGSSMEPSLSSCPDEIGAGSSKHEASSWHGRFRVESGMTKK